MALGKLPSVTLFLRNDPHFLPGWSLCHLEESEVRFLNLGIEIDKLVLSWNTTPLQRNTKWSFENGTLRRTASMSDQLSTLLNLKSSSEIRTIAFELETAKLLCYVEELKVRFQECIIDGSVLSKGATFPFQNLKV